MKVKGVFGSSCSCCNRSSFRCFTCIRIWIGKTGMGRHKSWCKSILQLILDADATSFSKAFIEVAEKVTPAIVQISVVAERDNPHKDFFFFPI
jgi:hypothetical protein